MPESLPDQRWHIAAAPAAAVAEIARIADLPELLARVLVNRGIDTPASASIHIDPERQELPPPETAFADLEKSVNLLVEAIENGEKIAICGDYDADGMTSTALLLRSLRALGADIDYAIPSRMREGYGINTRIVEDFAAAGVGLILTVDNGIAAHDAVRRAVELGLTVVITDHHDFTRTSAPSRRNSQSQTIAAGIPLWLLGRGWSCLHPGRCDGRSPANAAGIAGQCPGFIYPRDHCRPPPPYRALIASGCGAASPIYLNRKFPAFKP